MHSESKKKEAKDDAKQTDVAEGENDKDQPDSSISLLGVGGKQIGGAVRAKGVKKRTPGEIRIQRGERGAKLTVFI